MLNQRWQSAKSCQVLENIFFQIGSYARRTCCDGRLLGEYFRWKALQTIAMTEYRYYLEAHVINYPQGVILHWPVDIPAVGGGSQNGAEDAASPMADLSCRCLVVIVGIV